MHTYSIKRPSLSPFFSRRPSVRHHSNQSSHRNVLYISTAPRCRRACHQVGGAPKLADKIDCTCGASSWEDLRCLPGQSTLSFTLLLSVWIPARALAARARLVKCAVSSLSFVLVAGVYVVWCVCVCLCVCVVCCVYVVCVFGNPCGAACRIYPAPLEHVRLRMF